MARHVAKNLVAAGLAERAMLQVAYAIGVADPVSILVDTSGTGKVPDSVLEQLVQRHFDFTPSGIIKRTLTPIYKKTAAHGRALGPDHLGAHGPGVGLQDDAGSTAPAAGRLP
jgi:S-adenosylmethionine synthetase